MIENITAYPIVEVGNTTVTPGYVWGGLVHPLFFLWGIEFNAFLLLFIGGFLYVVSEGILSARTLHQFFLTLFQSPFRFLSKLTTIGIFASIIAGASLYLYGIYRVSGIVYFHLGVLGLFFFLLFVLIVTVRLKVWIR
jgi:hypothetical protein